MFKTLPLTLALCLLLSVPSLARGSFVYVSNYGDGTISQFRANPNGTLTSLKPPTVKAYPRCHSLAVARGHFLYALSSLEFSRRDCLVSQFRIGPDGRLTTLSPATVPVSSVGSGPSLISVDPAGAFAYVTGTRDDTFRVEADGRLTPMTPIQSVNEGLTGAYVRRTFHPSRPLLYESSQEDRMGPDSQTRGGVRVISIQPNGLLAEKPLQSLDMEGDTPLGVFLVRGGRFAYVPHNWNTRPTVSQYHIRADGRLDLLTPARVPLPGPADIPIALVDPQGRFFDVTVRAIVGPLGDQHPEKWNHLLRFAIGKNGMLRERHKQPLPVSGEVKDALFDPSGRFLYLLTGNGIRSFRVRSNGPVVPMATRSIRAGCGPLSLVYVQSQGGG